MPRALSLHPLNALDADPLALIEIAGALAVERLCLFTHVPEAAAGFYPLVTPADVPSVAAALADTGVTLCNLEVFPLDRDGDLAHLLEGLETGARLGATNATAHLHDVTGEQHAIDRFAAFAERAASFGITAGLEFNPFSGVSDIASAARIVRHAGCGTLVLDSLHLARSGGSPADAALVGDLIGYIQLSDGPATLDVEQRWHEAVRERQLPGDGAFPLAELLRVLPASAILEVEVPQTRARKSGVSALERCRRAIEATRTLLETHDQEHRA